MKRVRSGAVLAMVLCSALPACVLAAVGAKHDNAPKGWMILRAGAATSDDNYAKEDRDPNGRLQDVSILCGETNKPGALIPAGDAAQRWKHFGQSNVTVVVNLGGNVVKDPLPGNPHHCLIDGLTLSQIKGIWH